MKCLLRSTITLLLAMSAVFPTAFAQPEASEELTIKDTSGFTRAVSQVDGLGNVEFNLLNEQGAPAEGVEVTLTSADSAEVISAVAVNGAVIFESVPPGIWTVASAVPEVTFTNVAIGSSAALVPAAGAGAGIASSLGGISTTTAAVGGVAAAGVGTAAVASSRNNSSDKPTESPLSPSS